MARSFAARYTESHEPAARENQKEQKYEGVSFTPIWIEDENGRQTLATGKANVEMGAPTSEAPIAKPTRKRGTKRT